MKKIFFTGMSALCCFLLLAGNVFGANDHDVNNEVDSKIRDEKSASLEYNIKKRMELGFKSDSDYVKGLLEKKNQQDLVLHDFYMTLDEEKEFKERLAFLNERIPQVKAQLKTAFGDDNFGGLFVKQNEGGVLYVRIKGINNTSNLEIEKTTRLFGKPEKIKFIDAKFSEEELNEKHKQYSKIQKL
ncbi:hypothetical protein GE107_23360 [Cohnella sp. CFH 77786]|uniref:hypothetical protein n=1 Tax=Cohnella sp. CFH 77786 TaxID=2662265 RepID=UPI001C60F6D1|nr:hypothetical protein [Cohnella sp. CFH 77786]MBW5448981.1 hypothetical protein [Cohnella sp. CFH 77786]